MAEVAKANRLKTAFILIVWWDERIVRDDGMCYSTEE
jgi:hypothetical protein